MLRLNLKNWKSSVVPALLLSGLLVPVLPPASEAGRAAPNEVVDVYTLQQISQTYGSLETSVSKDGLKMLLGTVRISIKGPDFDLVFWNERTRYLFREPLDRFVAKIPRHVDKRIHGSRVRVIEAKPAPISGFPVVHYRWERWPLKYPDRVVPIYDFWTTRSLPVSQRVMDVAALCCYLPAGYGFPLKIDGARVGKPVTFLSTHGKTKSKMKRNFLDPPGSGYEKVNSEMAVLLKERTAAKDEDVSDLFKPMR